MSSRKKAKGGSVTDDMPSPSMLDGAALGATLDRVHCTTCDRPVATPREETTPRDEQNPAICYFNGGLACHKNEVDWRARCLAAEASLRDEESLCTTEVLARLQAKDIAREALVEGLAECERLRAMDSTLSAFDILIGAPSKEMAEADLVEAMARLVTDPPSPMMDAREGAAAREQAIRADSAREERERVVAWLRDAYAAYFVGGNADGGTTMGDICAAIERNDHAPGKGGEG